MNFNLRKSLANRILAMVILIVTILTTLFVAYYTLHIRSMLEKFTEESGTAFAQSIAQSSLLGVMASEPLFLEQTFAIAMSNPEVIFVAAYGANGSLIRESSRIPINLEIDHQTLASILDIGDTTVAGPTEVDGIHIDNFFAPVKSEVTAEGLSEELLTGPEDTGEAAVQTVGLIRIGLSTERIVRQQRISTLVGLLIGVSVLAFGIIFTIFVGRRITGPLKELEQGTRSISEGEMNVTLPIRTEDEVGAVAKAFNAMTVALRDTTVSRDYVDNIVGSMNDAMVVVDAQRKIGTLNSAAERLLGYAANELKGVALDALFTNANDHPFDARRWNSIISRTATNLEAQYRSKDGRSIPVSISSAPLMDRHGTTTGAVLIARDMREINSLLQQLRSHAAELERYQSVLLSMLDDNEKARAEIESERLKTLAAVNSMSEGLVMFSAAENRIDLINHAAKEMLGFEAVHEISLDDIKGVIGATMESFIRARESVEEGRLVHDVTISGAVSRTIRIEGVPVGQSGKRIGSMLVMRDITRERQLDEAKYNLISNVSHELRTPLAIISNVISNLLVGIGGPLPEKLTNNLKTCQSNTKRLAHIIDGLLDISTLDAGHMSITREMADVSAIVSSAVEPHKEAALEKGVNLSVEINVGEVRSYCDPRVIGEVLSNLVSNAIRYTPDGGTVNVAVNRAGDNFEYSVADTGIGIPPDEQRSIFEHFHQVGRTYGPGEKGVGLGLSISRQLVERHDGSIGVTSQPGRGSRFYFIIPDPKGSALLSMYLKERVASAMNEGRHSRLFFIASAEAGWLSGPDGSRFMEERVYPLFEGTEYVLIRGEEGGNVSIAVIAENEDAADRLLNALKVLVKELEHRSGGPRISVGAVSITSTDLDAADLIEAAKKASGA